MITWIFCTVPIEVKESKANARDRWDIQQQQDKSEIIIIIKLIDLRKVILQRSMLCGGAFIKGKCICLELAVDSDRTSLRRDTTATAPCGGVWLIIR